MWDRVRPPCPGGCSGRAGSHGFEMKVLAGCPEQGISVIGVTAHRVVEVIATELWGVVLISVALKKNYPIWAECCSNDKRPHQSACGRRQAWWAGPAACVERVACPGLRGQGPGAGWKCGEESFKDLGPERGKTLVTELKAEGRGRAERQGRRPSRSPPWSGRAATGGMPPSPVSACVHSPATGSSGAAAPRQHGLEPRPLSKWLRGTHSSPCHSRPPGDRTETRAESSAAQHRAQTQGGADPAPGPAHPPAQSRLHWTPALPTKGPEHEGQPSMTRGTPGSGGLGAWKGARASGACRWRPVGRRDALYFWTSWPGDPAPRGQGSRAMLVYLCGSHSRCPGRGQHQDPEASRRSLW